MNIENRIDKAILAAMVGLLVGGLGTLVFIIRLRSNWPLPTRAIVAGLMFIVFLVAGIIFVI